jgi:predicted phosphohydrolase
MKDKMTLIHLISDIHLEFNNSFPNIPSNIDILLLAGDIGFPHQDEYKEFLIYCSKKCKNVILITGNHEYYYSESFEKIDQKVSNLLTDITNVHFLQRDYIDINGFRIIGCTFWTKIPFEHSQKINNSISDYKKIYNITPNDINKLHQTHFDWLETEIDNSPLPIIIITHHAPSFKKTFDYSLDYAYYINIKKLNLDKVVLWAYGHTHEAQKYNHNVTTFWCNPVGYLKEKTGYSQSLIVQL